MSFNKIRKVNISQKNLGQGFVCIIICVVFAGCGSSSQTIFSSGSGPYYVNAMASEGLNNQIEGGFKSVRRIQNNAIYRSYIFSEEQDVRGLDLAGMNFEEQAVHTHIETISNAGTATVLYRGNNKAVLLTAAHTVVQPDTLIHFSGNRLDEPENFVEAVSVRVSTDRFVITDNGIVSIKVLNVDEDKDIALMITTGQITSRDQLRVLHIPPGDFDKIQWGDKVIAMGYPRGTQMVTSGVVSLSSHPHRTLVVDLNINRGFSGGLVYAISAESGRLEWIGMLTSAMGENLTYLAPENLWNSEYNPDIPYMGNIFVNSRPFIHYGIGYGVDVAEINRFVQESESVLLSEGIRFEGVY